MFLKQDNSVMDDFERRKKIKQNIFAYSSVLEKSKHLFSLA